MWLREFFHTQVFVPQQWLCQWRRRRKTAESSLPKLWIVFTISLLIPSCLALRCYTDVAGSKARSIECGLNTGCVKIFIDSEEMMLRRNQQYGYAYPTGEGSAPALPERYLDNPILLRGCFVLAVPDRCYTANNGLTYCWCSTKDLCNTAQPRVLVPPRLQLLALTAASLAVVHFCLVKSFLAVTAPS